MNTITLKKITLKNFKGIRDFSIQPNDSISNIFGANGTGKSSLFDAFTWLLFGKDSADKKDFQVKTLDENNVVIPKLDHEVSAEIDFNGKVISLRRLLTEKWIKTRGSETSVFSGNQTTYFWNDVEMGAKEFQLKVSEILDENIFKLITSPFAFNKLHWTEKRKVLTEIAGDISDEEIAKGNEKFEALISASVSDSISIDERKKQIQGALKRLNSELVDIPSRIDEVRRNAPEKINEEDVADKISDINLEIQSIDKKLQDSVSANAEVNENIKANQNKIYELKSELAAIEFSEKEKAKSEVRKGGASSTDLTDTISELNIELKSFQTKNLSAVNEQGIKLNLLDNLQKEKEKLTTQWHAANALEFTQTDSVCNCCGQAIEADLDALKERFIESKKSNLQNISLEGKSVANKILEVTTFISELKNSIQSYDENIATLSAELKELNSKPVEKVSSVDDLYNKNILSSVAYSKLKIDIATLESLKFDVPAENTELQNQRKLLFDEIIALKESIASNKLIELSSKRIEELQSEETKLSQDVAKQERGLFIIENFVKAKMAAVESKVNSKFSLVKLKMFEIQVNGAEAETCEILIGGVPYSDANTASQINAGVDIINTLSEYYQTSATIFLDNKESVSSVIPTKSQVINLIVSPEHKTLTLK